MVKTPAIYCLSRYILFGIFLCDFCNFSNYFCVFFAFFFVFFGCIFFEILMCLIMKFFGVHLSSIFCGFF